MTSTPEAREALRPLHSLWLDTLILRLLGTGQKSDHGVWIVLDELASLQKLPQLHTAITEGRKSKNRIVIGIQGSAQLETLYGQLAVTMLSQPSTKILLRTSEPRAAKWMQDTIGEIEIERFRESRQASYGFGGGKSSKSYSQERKTEPLISAAQISGLPNMQGYLKSGNYVVEMRFPYLALPTDKEALIRRDVNKIQFRKPDELPPLPEKKGAKSTPDSGGESTVPSASERFRKPEWRTTESYAPGAFIAANPRHGNEVLRESESGPAGETRWSSTIERGRPDGCTRHPGAGPPRRFTRKTPEAPAAPAMTAPIPAKPAPRATSSIAAKIAAKSATGRETSPESVQQDLGLVTHTEPEAPAQAVPPEETQRLKREELEPKEQEQQRQEHDRRYEEENQFDRSFLEQIVAARTESLW